MVPIVSKTMSEANSFNPPNGQRTTWRTLMAYFVLSRNCEESFNEFLSPGPDPDHPRGGPSHIDINSCAKNKVNRSNSF